MREVRTSPTQRMAGGPSLALVYGHFSSVGRVSDWALVEPFVNPNGMFREVHVVAIGDDGEYPTLRFGTVTIHPIPSVTRRPSLRRLNDVLGFMRGVRMLTQIVRERGIDLVAQIDSTPLKFGLPAVIVARRMGIPSVVTLCSDYQTAAAYNRSVLARQFGKLFWPFVLRSATRVRSKSHHIAGFAARHGVAPSRIAVIPNKECLETFMVRPAKRDLAITAKRLGVSDLVDGSLVLVTCARLIPIKNLERMLDAVALARQSLPDLAFLIVGEGPLLGSLQERASDLDISEHVRFLGRLSHAQLSSLYHLSDIFLFVTLFEGHPRALLEARLSGLPVIASDHGSVKELVADGRGGRLVDPQSVEEIAAAITELAGDPGLRRGLSEDPTFDPDSFSFAAIGAKEERLYWEALGREERCGPERGLARGSGGD